MKIDIDAIRHQIPPAPPAGFNLLVNIKRSMTMSLLAAFFSSMLIPMLVALLFFGDQHHCRRSPIYYMNIAALCFGIFEGIYLVTLEVREAFSTIYM